MGAPSGTVTFLFTDVEGSTRLWESAPGPMRAAIARHDEIVRRAIERHDGYLFATGGDGFAIAFARAADAVRTATDAQADLSAELWPEETPIRVRMGLHTGEVEERDGDYFGRAVNRAARLMGIGCGGQVLCSEVSAALIDTDMLLVDLGEHRLRDLDRPVHVFQVGDGLFPPLRSKSTRRVTLTPISRSARPTTTFFGREEELRLIGERIQGHRLVTLVGVGGGGKTRLAQEAVERLGTRFADGIIWVDLASVSSVGLVARTVAQAAGVFDASVDRGGDEAIEERLLGSIGEHNVLLVMDNCEHVVTEASRLCGLITESCPNLCILATSREPLGLGGEQRIPVGSLDADAARRLFCARAQAVGVNVDLSADDPVIDAICDRLDRLALAVELAAARCHA